MTTILSADQARGAVITGHLRYMLAFSMAGSVIGLSLVWLLVS